MGDLVANGAVALHDGRSVMNAELARNASVGQLSGKPFLTL